MDSSSSSYVCFHASLQCTSLNYARSRIELEGIVTQHITISNNNILSSLTHLSDVEEVRGMIMKEWVICARSTPFIHTSRLRTSHKEHPGTSLLFAELPNCSFRYWVDSRGIPARLTRLLSCSFLFVASTVYKRALTLGVLSIGILPRVLRSSLLSSIAFGIRYRSSCINILCRLRRHQAK